jgi:hypothetical protein
MTLTQLFFNHHANDNLLFGRIETKIGTDGTSKGEFSVYRRFKVLVI